MTITKEQARKSFKEIGDELYNTMQRLSEQEVSYFPEFFITRDENQLVTDRPDVEYMEVTFEGAVETLGVLEVALAANTHLGDKKFSARIDEMEELEDKL